METISDRTWDGYSEAFAFIGNSLLKPIRQTSQVGLDPSFWTGFPDFSNPEVAERLEALSGYAKQLAEQPDIDPVTDVSVEYTRLFVGPPRPASAPWETMYRGEGTEVGFGKATIEMRGLLRSSGLELHNENRQYEDHMGIEMLYLSVLCHRMATGDDGADSHPEPETICCFLEEHPLAWLGKFRANVHADSPDGYFDHLLALEETLIDDLHGKLK